MHLNVDVFPAPFNPNKPKHSPGSTQKFKFFIAIIFFCFLQQVHLFLNSFLIFFNLTTYSLFILLLTSFSLYIFISSLFALSISSKINYQ